MRIAFLILILGCFLTGCNSKDPYKPDRFLSAEEKDSVLKLIIRYVAKPPKGVTGSLRFDQAHDAFYQTRIIETRLEQFYVAQQKFYFLVSQPAPSLIEKRHATGGWLTVDEGGLKDYAEIFRTWKMVPDTLRQRSYMLFDKMVKNENLAPYYTQNSKGVEFIEFPDQHVFFNVESRSWELRPE